MRLLGVPVAALIASLAISCRAEDAQRIIDLIDQGMAPVELTEVPLLIPFAAEWDRIANELNGDSYEPPVESYEALTIPDEHMFNSSMLALSRNQDAKDFFTAPNTIAEFSRAHRHAQDSGSPIGMIQHEEALRFWIASRALTSGPDSLSAFQTGDQTVQWCLPPLILCSPPDEPVDPEENQ